LNIPLWLATILGLSAFGFLLFGIDSVKSREKHEHFRVIILQVGTVAAATGFLGLVTRQWQIPLGTTILLVPLVVLYWFKPRN